MRMSDWARRFPVASLLACVVMSGAWLPVRGAESRSGSALCQAIDGNNAAKVQAAIDGGADVNEVVEKDTLLCRAIAANRQEVVKVLLLVMAELGYCTLWFAAVLDGAAALGTLLMAIRAFGFDKPHHRVRDYLPKVKSK